MKGASAANVIAMVKAIARPRVRDRICSPQKNRPQRTRRITKEEISLRHFVSLCGQFSLFQGAAHCDMNDSFVAIESDC
jgi:hypothetical protein